MKTFARPTRLKEGAASSDALAQALRLLGERGPSKAATERMAQGLAALTGEPLQLDPSRSPQIEPDPQATASPTAATQSVAPSTAPAASAAPSTAVGTLVASKVGVKTALSLVAMAGAVGLGTWAYHSVSGIETAPRRPAPPSVRSQSQASTPEDVTTPALSAQAVPSDAPPSPGKSRAAPHRKALPADALGSKPRGTARRAQQESVSRKEQPAGVCAAAAEMRLLERAQQALEQAPRKTLRLLRDHHDQCPRGAFEQEREALAVEALFTIGRSQAAAKRGQAFLERFPGSVHAPRIRDLMTVVPQQPQ